MSAAVQPQLYQKSSPCQQPVHQAVQVVKVDVAAPGQQIVYRPTRNCSTGLGRFVS